MRVHTVALLRAVAGWETCDEVSRSIGLPVLAFYTVDSSDGSTGTGECEVVDPVDREGMSDTVYDLYRMVAMPDPPNDPFIHARNKITELRALLERLEAAADGQDFTELHNAAESVRHESERLAFALESWDATVPADRPLVRPARE